jgi:tripartite-type tricarboxylate transporter receptor subunit TctC
LSNAYRGFGGFAQTSSRVYMSSRRSFSQSALLLSAGFAFPPLFAQGAWPAKPIKLVVPFPPGGATDLIAQLLAAELSKSLKRQVSVESRPGAGGNLGSELVAKATPDGYTLLMGTVGTHAINKSIYPALAFDPEADFAPISCVAVVPNVLVMATERARELKINSVIELIRFAKSNPGKLNMASTGNGTSTHLAGELFKSMTGTFMLHFPYPGSQPALQAVLSGKMDVIFDNVPSSLPLIKSGKLKALGLTSNTPLAALPNVPTIAAETGLKEFEASPWFGVFAPANTPRDVVALLSREIGAVLARADVKQNLADLGAVAAPNTPAEFASFIKGEGVKWAKVAKRSGARVEERTYSGR